MPELIRVCPTVPEGAAARDKWVERTDETGTAYLEQVVTPLTDAETAAGLAGAKAVLRGAVAARRYMAETGGVTVADVPIDTSRASQALIAAAALQATLDANGSIRWKAADGAFHTLDAATILNVATAVRAHVQAAFDREAALVEAIAAASDLANLRAIDIEAGWPG